MAERQTASIDTLPLPLARRVDDACRRFMAAWRAVSLPRINQFLGDSADPEERAVLDYELALLVRELRAELAGRPDVDRHLVSIDMLPLPLARRVDEVCGRFEAAWRAVPLPRINQFLGDSADPEEQAVLEHQLSLLDQAMREDLAGRPERFPVLRFHAKGNLGEVFVAEDRELGRDVALKRIQDPYADDPASRARFLLEAEITGKLEHPGIVPVYRLGTYDGGRPYYVMRFIKGDNFKEVIAAFHADGGPGADPGRRSLELRKLLRRFLDACDAVEYAHSRGVLHRDIKPGNVIVGQHGQTLVIDWGLAKVRGRADVGSSAGEPPLSLSPGIDSDVTLPGSTLGTPTYMSPEQARGDLEHLGPQSDVYSLGATLYCLLTGRPPYAGDDVGQVLAAVQKGEFPPPRTLVPSTDRALEAVCRKAMALRPEDRYGSARALADDIERWLADQPVLACREPLSARVSRWVRRHRQWVWAAAAVLVAASIGLAVHAWRIAEEKARTATQLNMTIHALDVARDSLRELLKVSGENLALVPNTEALREYLARLVLERYGRLEEKFPGDPGIRLETAQVHRVIGGIRRLTGEFEGSRESYDKAIALLTGLCKEAPEQADYRLWLTEAHTDRGELSHMCSSTIDAERDFRAAIGQADRSPSFPISPTYRRAKASALINLSEVLVLEDRHPEARATADRAVGLLEPLAKEAPTSDFATRDRWLLCMALIDRGVASEGAGDRDAARHDLDNAKKVAGQVPRGDGVFDDAQFQTARAYNYQGYLLAKDLARPFESLENYERASRILDKLIGDHTAIPHYREELAATLAGRAAARLAMDQISDAERDCRAALEQLAQLVRERASKQAPENPQYLSLLGRALALEGRIRRRQGRPIEARKAFEEAAGKVSRAIRIDPARELDKVFFKRITKEIND
jgi:eukaryotic-like serine/threonine-protein kinase